MNAKDTYLISNGFRCVLAYSADGVRAAMEDLGQMASVRRITDGELSRDVTHSFQPETVLDYPEDGDWDDRYQARMEGVL